MVYIKRLFLCCQEQSGTLECADPTLTSTPGSTPGSKLDAVRGSTRGYYQRSLHILTDLRVAYDYDEDWPKLANFLSANGNFVIYRRFGYLQARVLLYKQDELRRLEEELKRQDEAYYALGRTLEREKRAEFLRYPKHLIGEITEGFREYGKLSS